jgi:hypothetical protein
LQAETRVPCVKLPPSPVMQPSRAGCVHKGLGTSLSQETCEVLVLDRGYDAVAPFIHEWSYEALAYDLVTIEGNVYK